MLLSARFLRHDWSSRMFDLGSFIENIDLNATLLDDWQVNPVARSLFFSGMGSNNCLNDYPMPNFPTPSQFKAQHFDENIGSTLHQSARFNTKIQNKNTKRNT